MFSAGLDTPGVYHGVSAGGLDVRQLADAGEKFLLPLVLYLICCDVSLLLNTGVFVFSDLEQLDLLSLCCGVLRFLQDLPGPILPSMLQADMIRAVQGEIWSLALLVLIYMVKPLCPFLLCHRGPRRGGLCSGVAMHCQLVQLPRSVWPDAAQRCASPGPGLPAWFQKPTEPSNPGGELQPSIVQAQCRVSYCRYI